MTNGEGKVSYEIDGQKYKRTYFGSYPAKAMVYRYESGTKTNYEIEYKSPHKMNGESFSNLVYSYQGEVADNGMQFETCLKIETDGEVTFENKKLKVSNAKMLTIYHVAATDYTLDYPKYKGHDFKTDNKNSLSKLEGKSYKEVLNEHQKDYKNLFARVELNLGGNSRDTITTDRRLKEYANGTIDLGLEQLYFQYSRYLMISASRPRTMPMHLQGKWNNSTNPPWACDYHMNINQQMLYWPAEVRGRLSPLR